MANRLLMHGRFGVCVYCKWCACMVQRVCMCGTCGVYCRLGLHVWSVGCVCIWQIGRVCMVHRICVCVWVIGRVCMAHTVCMYCG